MLKKSLKKFLSINIKAYQIFISPILVSHTGLGCRFYPSCSEFTRQSILKKGIFKGSASGIIRILKCNPFFKGGIDLP